MPTAASGRIVGVTIPEQLGRSPEGVPDLTVLSLQKLEFFGAQYTENGKIRMGLLVKSGEDFYLDPRGDQWVGGLRPLSDKLKKSAMDKYIAVVGVDAKDLPIEDNVDVVAQEVSE
jgi:hypothetical protein